MIVKAGRRVVKSTEGTRRMPALQRRVLGQVVARQGVRKAGAEPTGAFTALAVRYMDGPDDYSSLWWPGVFTKSLNARLPTICWAHDWSKPIGHGVGWSDSTEGPYIDAQLDMHQDVPLARQAAAQIASGTLLDVSVGFSNARRRDPSAEELRRWPTAREVILEATLDELSIVLRGAVKGAQIVSHRSAGGRALDRALDLDELDLADVW